MTQRPKYPIEWHKRVLKRLKYGFSEVTHDDNYKINDVDVSVYDIQHIYSEDKMEQIKKIGQEILAETIEKLKENNIYISEITIRNKNN